MKNIFTGNTGYAFLVISFVLSVVGFLYLNVYEWTIYPAVGFAFLFVFQLFAVIRNSGLDISLKKDIYFLAGLLMMVIFSNILWVFVFPWFKYIASVSALFFVYVLFTKLRNGFVKNE